MLGKLDFRKPLDGLSTLQDGVSGTKKEKVCAFSFCLLSFLALTALFFFGRFAFLTVAVTMIVAVFVVAFMRSTGG